MEKIKNILILSLLFFPSCSTAFPYKWYGLQANSYEGKLLGEKPKDDLPFKTCEPDDFVKGKCVVMKVSDFKELRLEYVELKTRLQACEVR